MVESNGRLRNQHLMARAVITVLILTGACAPSPEVSEVPEVLVGGVDYAFQLPGPIPSGPVKIAFENRGQVPHELVLLRLKAGVTLDSMVGVMRSGGEREDVVDAFGGVLIADPGEIGWGRLFVELEPGRTYALVCNFTDEEGDPPHTALGMISSFTAN